MPTVTTPAPTFEDVWRTMQEVALAHKEADRLIVELRESQKESQKENDRLMAELRESQKETDRQLKETDRQLKESARELKEAMKDTDQRLKALTRQMGAQGNRLGEFVQEMVRPAVVGLFQDRGWPVHQVLPNIVAYDDDRRFVMEIDLLVVDTATAIAVECKSHLTQADVDEHLERLSTFKRWFPQYAPYALLGAVAAMVLPDEVGRYAYRKGLYVLAQSGEAVEIRNDAKFQPKNW